MSKVSFRNIFLMLQMIVLITIFFSAVFSEPAGTSQFLLSPFFRLGAALTLVLFLFYIFKIKKVQFKWWMEIIVITMAFFVQIIFLLYFFRPVYTDTGVLTTMIGRLIEGNHHWFDYYYIYPNNVNTTIFWAILLKPLHWLGINFYQVAIHWIQMVLLDVGIVYLSFSLRKINLKIAKSFFYLALFYMPWFMFTIFPYNDILAIFLLMLSLGAAINLLKTKKKFNQFIFSIFTTLTLVFAVILRQNSIIILIAFILSLILAKGISKKIKTLLVFFAFFLTLIGTIGAAHVAQDEGFYKNPTMATPAVRWINMSWNPKTSGEIDGDDSSLYGNLPSKERSKKITIELKHRLHQLGFKGIIHHLWKKISFMFSWGFSNQDMGGLKIDKPLLSFPSQTTEVLNLLNNLFQPFYILILFFAIYAIFSILVQKIKINTALNFLTLFSSFSILGIFSFHVFLWEVRDRYVLPILPFILILAAVGFVVFVNQIQTEHWHSPRNKKSYSIIILAFVFLLFVLGFKIDLSKIKQPVVNMGNVYSSGYIFYTEADKEVVALTPGVTYKTETFNLTSNAQLLNMYLGNLNEHDQKNIHLILENTRTKKQWSLPVNEQMLNFNNVFKSGQYQFIIQNTGMYPIKMVALKNLETKNIQGPGIFNDGKFIPGYNLSFSFYDFKNSMAIPKHLLIFAYTVFVLLLLAVIIFRIFLKDRQQTML
ncbi:hypothetical protein GHU05_01270 [Fructobacillus tropaeoli]|uniref:hypothetical protein n=1 Tax=Fructobacillus tropaeoli TaxID=709323 RepID=UPI0014561A34|nr:hypothetical protein [Fructobacillus tropaeoli]NLS37563.1 hypothetical protein [Fructobacillus tropaeoli]